MCVCVHFFLFVCVCVCVCVCAYTYTGLGICGAAAGSEGCLRKIKDLVMLKATPNAPKFIGYERKRVD